MELLFLNWLFIAAIALVGAMSPGPDFVITVKNSIIYSRKAGIMTGVGITLGLGVHIAYCMLGLAVVITHSVALFNTIKYVGAAYLLYIGYKSLLSSGYNESSGADRGSKKDLSAFAAFCNGFFTNLLNPKATMFFLALFTQVIDPQTSLEILLLYSVTIVVIGFLWWMAVAIVLTDRRIKNIFLGFSKWIDRMCGGLMIALGLKLALSKGHA